MFELLRYPSFVEADGNDNDDGNGNDDGHDNDDEWMTDIVLCCLKKRQSLRDTWLETLMWLDFFARTVCWIYIYIKWTSAEYIY